MAWSNGLAEWIEGDTAYLSIVFSWRLRDAYSRAAFYRSEGYKVRAGGPAVWANRKYASILAEICGIGGEVDALPHHNALATIASRGCPVGCWFCVVPKMEGKVFTLLPDFIPRPILCDNNLSALPEDYQEYIIQRYQDFGVELQDANSGFEPKTFDDAVYRRWQKINRGVWRFAYDEEKEGADVFDVMQMLKDVSPRYKRVYVLIGNEPKESCLRRVHQVIEWGGEPHVQPLIALNALEKKYLVRHDWTERELADVARWANRFLWRTIPFSDYAGSVHTRRPVDLQLPLPCASAL